MAPQTGFGFLIPDHYVLEDVTREDIIIASLAWGFTIGFGWLTAWTALKQTKQMWKRHGTRVFRNAYIWMIWLEILVCMIFGVICFLYLLYIIPPSFEFYFVILTTWALQVQFLLQIIVNRCAILLTDPKKANRLKFGVAVLITLVNISVYNIWIPARLQISDRYIWINEWWDRIEKGIYLLVDACLNFYFIHIVKQNLVMHGLTKYRTLMHFNMFIVGFSLSMDVLIIAMMSLPNTFVYMQFHPLAYIVKLNIEMSMADLIGKIARNRNCGVISEGDFSNSVESGPPTGTGGGSRNRDSRCLEQDMTRARRHHPQFMTFELRSVGTGADVGTFMGTGSILERSRFNSDSDTIVNRPDPAKTHSIMGGVDTPREVYHYGSYGVAMQKKDFAVTGISSVAESLNGSKGQGSGSSGTSYGEEDGNGGTWYEEDLDKIRAQVTSRDGILRSPTTIKEVEEQPRLAPDGPRRPNDGKSRSRSRERGWSPFRRVPPSTEG